MMTIREETPPDAPAREALLDACFGEERFRKTCQRLREGRKPAASLSLTLENADNDLIGTVRLWHVSAGPNRPALLLGPIAIDPSLQGLGLGSKLMRAALQGAARLGHKAVLLVGDAPYYERFGFSTGMTERLWLPGPYERERFVGLELEPGALAGARGLVSATGELLPKPDFATLVAAAANDLVRARERAA
jgi:predicted N-acetyltransferase YhbS